MRYYKLFLLLAIIGIVLAYAYPRVAAHASGIEMSSADWVISPVPVPPLLHRIALCESKHGQFFDGHVVTHENTNGTFDIGAYQINDTHLEEATRLGWDLYSFRGNESYAFYLFEREGSIPWDSSIGCWG